MLFFSSFLMAAKKFAPMVPYGVKRSKNYKSTRLQQRLALESARKQKEMKGMILDSRKTLFMSLRDNTGINWYRAKQILKHLEVHQRHPNVTSQAMREKITEIANLVKQGK